MTFIKRYSIQAFLIWGLLTLSMAVNAQRSYALDINIIGEATVQDDTIYLKDIARFHPQGDARVSSLGRIEVASAPSPGREIRLNHRFLHYKIGSAVPDDKDIDLKIPQSLIIKRAAQTFSSKDLEALFKEHVISHAQWPEDKMTFERINTPASISLPEGDIRWEIQEQGMNRYTGNISLVVNFFVDGKEVRKVPVSGRVTVSQTLVKATRKIRSGEMIDREDLKLVEEKRANLRNNTPSDLDEVVGKRAVRSIREGSFITPRMFEDPPMVKKGKRVIIKAENKSIKVATLGRVLEDGREGDQVRVLNISSGKEVVSVVRGPGMVEVLF